MRRKAVVISAIILLASVAALAAEGRFERTLKVNGKPDVDISTGSGNITVRTGDANTVRIVGHIRTVSWLGLTTGSEEKVRRIEQNPPITQTGEIIRVGRFSDPELGRNVSISYEVTVPPNTDLGTSSGSGDQDIQGITAPVKTSTGSGNVRLDRITGQVKANTGSGDILASQISGRFDGRTGSGNVSVRQAQLEDVEASTGSGDIELDGVKGRLRARTGSGNISANGSAVAAWDLQTSSGDVRVSLPGTAAFDIDASTSSGDIRLAREVATTGTMNKKRVRGKVNGGGPLVMVHTSSGSVEIR